MADIDKLPYRVIQTEEQYKLDKTGKLVLMKIAHYETALGDKGTVFMPASNFDADTLTAMIESDVAEIAKLHGYK